MADVEQRAEAEAEKKGLSGKARKSYIGGVWNRIKQAHAKATQHGGHAVPKKLMNRRARQQAREDARNAMRPHQEAIANIRKQREFRLGLHRDESQPKREPSNAQLQRRIMSTDLKPIRHIESGEGIGESMAAGPNPQRLRDIYGQEQLPKALDLFPTASLREAARTRGMSAGGSREALIARLAKPQPTEAEVREKRERGLRNFPRARDRQT